MPATRTSIPDSRQAARSARGPPAARPPPSPLPPSSPPAQSSSPSRVPRLSDPTLPVALAPTEPWFQDQEPKRKRANQRLTEGLARVAANPEVTWLREFYKHDLEDYEEEFGRFLPDKDVPEYIAAREEGLEHLKAERLRVARAEFTDRRVAAYFEAVDAFAEDFGILFEPLDDLTDDLNIKRNSVTYMQRLREAAGGSLAMMRELAVADVTVHGRNPYAQDDLRRSQLDARFHEYLNHYAPNHKFAPTLHKTSFEWTLSASRSVRLSLNRNKRFICYCHAQQFKGVIERLSRYACDEAGVTSTASFYGSK
ncbi:hypothetical protein C8R46DRAFT_1221992 [Mycena filopes]|nr:hypothetical protein C8R46DRAFT_1221992 [Mycena filopes]